MPSGTVAIARASTLATDVPIAARHDGVELVVLKWRDRVRVFQGACPHQGTALGTGSVDDGALVCPMHGWRFDCATGEKLGDAGVCLRSFSTWIEGDEVRVSRQEILDALARPRAAAAGRERLRPLHQIWGPKGLPLLGNLLQLDLTRLHLVLEAWSDRHGPLYGLRLGRKRVVVVSEPGIIQEILRARPDTYRRLTAIDTVLEEIGIKGVFSAEKDDWRRQRRLVTQALNAEHLRFFFATLAMVTERLKRRLQRAAVGGAPIDVQKDLMRFTVDVTTGLAFGYDMNTIESDGDIIQHHLEHIFPMINHRVNTPIPYWRYVKLPADRRLDRALAAVRATTAELIATARARLNEDASLAARPRNFLEALLAEAAANGFTDEDVFGNVITMLLAGEDTTANTLAWMLHFVVDRPDVMQAMRDEVDPVLGSGDPARVFDGIQRLAYVEAVANETMRLKPVAPLLFLEADQDVEIGGFAVPPGTPIFLLLRAAGLRDTNFLAAAEFRAERWLGSDQQQLGPHETKAFLPFGGGPRFCPGRHLAMLEIKAVMAMICRDFSIARPPGAPPVTERFAFSMFPENLQLTFSRRE